MPPPHRSGCTPPTQQGGEKCSEAMSAARRKGKMAVARVFSATQIARARAGAMSEVVGSTLDCRLVPRKFKCFSAK